MQISLRRLLSRLTAIALSAAAPVAAADADTSGADLDLAGELPVDPELIDPPDAAVALGRSLALAVGNMRPIVATELAASWATSPDPVKRLALATSLEWMFPLLGDRSVLDHLARDPDPAVRAAVARAAWARSVRDVLDHLADDPDPEVRAIVQR